MSKKNSAKPATESAFIAKGGCGKSTLASLLASTEIRLGQVDLFDTDPSNQTMRRYVGGETRRV